MDAQKQQLCQDGLPIHNQTRREARKWFKARDRSEIGGWGWIIDSLNLPSWFVLRIERAAIFGRPIRIEREHL